MFGAGLPDGVEEAIKADPGGDALQQAVITGQKGGQGRADMGVAAALGSG
jgi:hypothetical protein